MNDNPIVERVDQLGEAVQNWKIGGNKHEEPLAELVEEKYEVGEVMQNIAGQFPVLHNLLETFPYYNKPKIMKGIKIAVEICR